MHLDVTVEAPRELRRDQRLELLVSRAAREPTRNEQRLVSGRNSQPLQLCDGRCDRSLAGIALRARQRQVWRLDDDRRARAARHERFERLAGEWEAQRVADGRADVRDGVRRRRRLQNDGIVISRHDDDLRAGEQRDPLQGTLPRGSASENG